MFCLFIDSVAVANGNLTLVMGQFSIIFFKIDTILNFGRG